MSTGIKNINITRKTVLVAPLDWGLGHTTRCIPIIQALQHHNFIVLIAAEGNSAALLSKEFPNITILPLGGYNISYSHNRALFNAKIFFQIPKILRAIKKESKWLKQMIKEYKVDIVISDNRYGLYNRGIKSLFITHQLAIETGSKLTNRVVQKLNYKLINKFDACWIPDEKTPNDLAGKLSNPNKLPAIPVNYIGALSRFQKEKKNKNIDLLVLLSGPEPQRTILEKLMLEQMNELQCKMILIRGLPSVEDKLSSNNKEITIYNHLTADELSTTIQSSKIVIARSGYSTIMDLVALQQKAILIPTPGQTEQEYLAKYLAKKKYFIAANQIGFNLKKEIGNLESLQETVMALPNKNNLEKAIIALK